MTIDVALPRRRSDAGVPVELHSGDFDVAQDMPTDAILRAALGECSNKKHMMELVCELFGDPTTDEVRSLLARCDARVSRQHASKVVNGWRRNHQCHSQPDKPGQEAATAIAVSPDAVMPSSPTAEPMLDDQRVDASPVAEATVDDDSGPIARAVDAQPTSGADRDEGVGA
jgi:hypothetical protein